VKGRRENDKRRKFDAEDYFVRVLFTLLNPVIASMRGLCAISGSQQFAKQTGIARDSLGSFSEAQAVFSPDVPRGVLRELLGRAKSDPPPSLGLLERIGQIGSDFVVRLQDQAVIHELERLPVGPADRAEGITHHLRVSLGERGAKDLGWRLVRLERPGGFQLMIPTSLPADQIGPWELCELHRQRWKIEGFFRWLKCALPCRHWLAESREGVSIQIYCALIAALLLSTRRGRLPTKREKEALDFWSMGWLNDDELAIRLGIIKEA
jgi:hypothetical protein